MPRLEPFDADDALAAFRELKKRRGAHCAQADHGHIMDRFLHLVSRILEPVAFAWRVTAASRGNVDGSDGTSGEISRRIYSRDGCKTGAISAIAAAHQWIGRGRRHW
ncbi:hypothetical protein WJ968_23160 [Achromobacter xylosoxidans]